LLIFQVNELSLDSGCSFFKACKFTKLLSVKNRTYCNSILNANVFV